MSRSQDNRRRRRRAARKMQQWRDDRHLDRLAADVAAQVAPLIAISIGGRPFDTGVAIDVERVARGKAAR